MRATPTNIRSRCLASQFIAIPYQKGDASEKGRSNNKDNLTIGTGPLWSGVSRQAARKLAGTEGPHPTKKESNNVPRDFGIKVSRAEAKDWPPHAVTPGPQKPDPGSGENDRHFESHEGTLGRDERSRTACKALAGESWGADLASRANNCNLTSPCATQPAPIRSGKTAVTRRSGLFVTVRPETSQGVGGFPTSGTARTPHGSRSRCFKH